MESTGGTLPDRQSRHLATLLSGKQKYALFRTWPGRASRLADQFLRHRQVARVAGTNGDMFLNRMLKERQDIFVLGELLLFLGAWGLCVAAAVEDSHVRHNGNADNNVAANVDLSAPN